MLDSGWLFGYLCFSLAALTSSTTLTSAEPEELRYRPGRLALVGLALVATNVASALGAYAVNTDAELIVTVICSVVLAAFVVARMAIVIRAHDRALAREAGAREQAVLAQHEAEAARRELAAEHARLLESEIRFRAIFEHAGLAMALVTPQRKVLVANPGALRLFGCTLEELRATGVPGVTNPDDRDSDDDLFAELIAGSRDAYRTEKRYVRRDGSVFVGRLTYSVARDQNGSVMFAIAIIEDVTEIREAQNAVVHSEQRLERMFEDARIAMALTDDRGRWVRANAALCALLGYSEQELCSSTFAEVTHPDDVTKGLDAQRQLLAGEIDSFETEKRYIRRDGRVSAR